jgi:hypothetical protein
MSLQLPPTSVPDPAHALFQTPTWTWTVAAAAAALGAIGCLALLRARARARGAQAQAQAQAQARSGVSPLARDLGKHLTVEVLRFLVFVALMGIRDTLPRVLIKVACVVAGILVYYRLLEPAMFD